MAMVTAQTANGPLPNRNSRLTADQGWQVENRVWVGSAVQSLPAGPVCADLRGRVSSRMRSFMRILDRSTPYHRQDQTGNARQG